MQRDAQLLERHTPGERTSLEARSGLPGGKGHEKEGKHLKSVLDTIFPCAVARETDLLYVELGLQQA